MFEGRYRSGLPIHSWCHGWSADPPGLPAFGLGVRPTSPGWKTVLVDPHPGQLQWAEGTVPKPYGNIGVKWELHDGKCHVEYEAPQEISGAL